MLAALDSLSRRYGGRPGEDLAVDLDLDPGVSRWFVLLISWGAVDIADLRLAAGLQMARSRETLVVPTLNLTDLPR
jgi:hypothetical protein